MQLTSTLKNDLLTIHADCRIACHELDGMKDVLAALVGENGFAQTVLLDLSRTLYIDSAGISWLLVCHRQFRDAGGALIFHSLTPMVLQMIRLMRLDRVFQLADDARSARQLAEGAES